MRPTKLEVEGFTSFRERCEIDFSCFDLFAITGQTGAGKTSLLDAMTWALYGKTSRLNKAGKDLVTQGASRMSVSLRFRAGSGEYQVSRAMQGPLATARLEKLEQGKWRSLSGHAAEIGQKVEGIIGLDFDGFTKSVILPQGKFDQFLRGSRKEQRETLNDLLDMQVYQRMVQSANAKKSLAGELAAAKQAALDPQATGEAKAAYERELARLTAEEEQAADAVDRLRQALPDALALREKRKARQASEGELATTRAGMPAAEAALEAARKDLDRWRQRAEALDHEIAALEYDGELHVRLAQLEQLALRRQSLIEELAVEERKRSVEETKLQAAEQTVQTAEGSQAGAANRLREREQSLESAKAAFSELRSRHGSADAVRHAADELEKAQSQGAEIPGLREEAANLEARSSEARAECEAARQAVAEAEAGLESARANYEACLARDRVAALRQELTPGEPCPVCEQTVRSVPAPLDAQELARARAQRDQAEATLRKLRDDLASARAEAEALPGRIELAHRKVELCESAMKSAADRAARILANTAGGGAVDLLRVLAERIRSAESATLEAQSGCERARGDERRASQALQDARHERNLISSRIANIGERAASLRQEIGRLDDDLRDASGLEEIAARMSRLRQAKQQRAALETSRSQCSNDLKQAEESTVRCARDVEELERLQTKCAADIEALDREIGKLSKLVHTCLGASEAPDSRDEAARIDSVQAAGQKDLETLQARVQQCRFAIQSMDEKIARNRRLTGEIARHKAEEALYRDLATWLNGSNFQQYLMSSAFELLAHEGSGHLKELSNGRYTFAYDDKEFQVLDRWNGDESRSVNTLSGGESFLASLSLALALAESITELNPAGGAVALESLFLDEGFSTLDAESQARVADAMQVLQGGKRLIGIVTHVQALADQMPAKIEIERTLSGSRIRRTGG